MRETVVLHILSLLNGISFSSRMEHASLPGAAGTLRGRSPAGVPQRGHAVRPAFRIRRAPRQRQKADPSQPEKAGLHKKAASATDGEAAFL